MLFFDIETEANPDALDFLPEPTAPAKPANMTHKALCPNPNCDNELKRDFATLKSGRVMPVYTCDQCGLVYMPPVYTPDEMGVDTDEEGYIESPSVTISGPEYKAKVATGDAIVEAVRDSSDLLDYLTEDEPKPAKKGNGKFARPMTPEILKEALETKVAELGEYGATDKQRNLLGSLLSQHFQDDTKRYEASKWLFGAASTKQIDGALVKAALDWLKPEKDDGGAYVIDRDAQAELSSVLTVALQAAGQMAL